MPDMAYAVHTRTCTYLLDEEGVCRWVLSPTGTIPPDGQRSVGAQFVACLDLRVAGGLVGELLIGASILFARRDDETGRLVLLRTSPIEYVEFKKPPEASTPRGAPAKLPPPPPREPKVHDDDGAPIDPEDMVTYEGGAVTLTMPLYRPDAQPVSPPRRKMPTMPTSDETTRDRGSPRGRRR